MTKPPTQIVKAKRGPVATQHHYLPHRMNNHTSRRKMLAAGLGGVLHVQKPLMNKVLNDSTYSKAVSKLARCFAKKRLRRRDLVTELNVRNAVSALAKMGLVAGSADQSNKRWSNVHNLATMYC